MKKNRFQTRAGSIVSILEQKIVILKMENLRLCFSFIQNYDKNLHTDDVF